MYALKSYEFRKEREASWTELEDIVVKVEKKGLRSLDAEELHRLPTLYRATLSSLSTARAISLDKNVTSYLESLSARAYVHVYATRRPALAAIADFFGQRFPALVRAEWKKVAACLALLALGTVTGAVLTFRDPERFYAFISADMAGDRSPASSREHLLRVLRDHGGGATEALTHFASFLFTHNAKIGLLCFGLGFLAGVPVLLLVFMNGLTLGAMAAIYAQHDLSLPFWLWILPHGVTELLAVAICAAGGLRVAERLVFPGRFSRLDELSIAGREGGSMAIGAVALFFVAALIEGFFRQLVQSDAVRAVVALSMVAVWIAYFRHAGQRRRTWARRASSRSPRPSK